MRADDDDAAGEAGVSLTACCLSAKAAPLAPRELLVPLAAAAEPLFTSYMARRRLESTHSSHVESVSGETKSWCAAVNGPLLIRSSAAVHTAFPFRVGVDDGEGRERERIRI